MKTLISSSIPRFIVRSSAACLMAIATGASALGDRPQPSAKQELAPNQRLLVNVEDIAALAHIETDFIRGNLLENAFYRAAADAEWLGKFDFRYNYNVPSDRGGYLEFSLTNWERGPAKMYEGMLTARYRTVDGETINHGTFYGSHPGITVVTGWDVTDAFVKAAQEAFDKALEELAQETAAS